MPFVDESSNYKQNFTVQQPARQLQMRNRALHSEAVTCFFSDGLNDAFKSR